MLVVTDRPRGLKEEGSKIKPLKVHSSIGISFNLETRLSKDIRGKSKKLLRSFGEKERLK